MLKILPSNISNLIAAGEVVQRPSSVVKELMENAIDAGANNVSVIIEDSGRTLIQVIDDGCGMTPEEAKLSFERHATSKIDKAEDLNSILTYGFRGEALASIAAVADVTMRSRKKESDMGCETIFIGGEFRSQEAAACPDGTNIAVRNIFYNVPARRKFMKSDNSEFRQIISEFSRVALCRPEVGLKLIHNKKEIFILHRAMNLKQRIVEVEGRDLNKELVDLSVNTSIISISGFIGNPEDARKTPGNQFLFVNGRFFKSAYFHKAITKAYEKLVPDSYIPSYYIFFEVAPESIDINIHPAKTEVKFESESDVFEILNAAVREALGKSAFVPSIDFNQEGAPDIPPARKGLYTPPPKIDFDPLFNPFDSFASPAVNQGSWTSKESSRKYSLFPQEDITIPEGEGQYTIPNFNGYGTVFEDDPSSDKNLIILHGKYIVTTVKSGLLLICISRAKERIFYERYIKSLDDSTPIAIGTLFPVSIKLSAHDRSLLMEDPGRLKMLGFEIEPEGDSSVVVNGLPDGFASDMSSVQRAVDDLIATFMEINSQSLLKADGRHKVAVALARSAAKESYSSISRIEAQLLVESLFSCAEPDRTPGGRKTMEIIKIEDLEKRL